VSGRRSRWGRWSLTSRPGEGTASPSWLPVAHDVARRMAARVGGRPSGSLSDVVGSTMTAHFIGGCAIGATPTDGVVDPYLRVHGYPQLHVVDGAAVSANLGVNPSLTITAQAERAFALWPNRGDRDPRPVPGAAYEHVPPVPPVHPVVPPGAPGALSVGLDHTGPSHRRTEEAH
jgi:cholesterol oxidase